MENKRLIKKTGLYLIGNLSSKLLTVLLLPIYAVYVATDDFGAYDYWQTIMNIAVPIAYLAIWEAILKFVLQEDDSSRKESIIATSSIFTIFISVLILLLTVLFNFFVSHDIRAIFYVTFMIISYAMAFIWQYYARSLGENKIYVLTGIIGTVVNFTSNIFLICVLNGGLEALFTSYILGNLAIFIILELKMKILIHIKFKNVDLKILFKMVRFSAPLVLNLISVWLINGFGRTIIKTRLGEEANGIYAFANKFAIIITMLGSVINMAIIEEALISAKQTGSISKDFTKTIEMLFKLFQSMIILAVPVITVFYFFIEKTDYYSSRTYFPPLLLYSLIMIMSTSFGTVFQVIDKTKYQFVTTVMGAFATVLISYLFIDRFELYAVIFAQLAGAFIMLVSRYFFINLYVKFRVSWIPIIGLIVLYVVVNMISLNTNVLINIFLFFVCLVFILLLNREYLFKLVSAVKSKI